MASDRRPGNLAHLERLLSAWSREGDQAHATAGRLRRLVAISALATMLDGLTENGDTHLAFKGGASMEFRFGATARASRDVDALADVDFDEAFAEIGRRLRTGWEGFTGTLTERTEIIRAGIVPAPQRCKIKLSYRDRPFATLAFELGRAEANSFELLEEVANATNMDKVQLGPNSDKLFSACTIRSHRSSMHAPRSRPRAQTLASTISTMFCCSQASPRTQASPEHARRVRTRSCIATNTHGRQHCRTGTTGSSFGTRSTSQTTSAIRTERHEIASNTSSERSHRPDRSRRRFAAA
jgi:hypothetical protein